MAVKVGTRYRYATGKYEREKLAHEPSDTVGYRVIPVKGKPGQKILIAIRRGGGSKAVALLRRLKGTSKVRGVIVKRMKRKRQRGG